MEKHIIYILSVFAMPFSVSILVFYIHASQIVGHLPYYNNPDPKELYIYKVYEPFVSFTVGVWFYSFFLWLIFIVIYLIITKERNYKPILITSAIQAIPFIILFSSIFEWYAD